MRTQDVFRLPSTSASISASVDPSALASLSACTMEGVLSALSTAPMDRLAHEEAQGRCYVIFENRHPGGASGVRPAKVSTWHIRQTTQPEINGHVGDALGLRLPPYLWA